MSSQISFDEYEKITAENEASEAEKIKLMDKYQISQKFSHYYAVGENAENRERAFKEESSKLVFHTLPHFYAPGYSITFYHTLRWFEFIDSGKDIDSECYGVKEKISNFFGNYNYLVSVGGRGFGLPEDLLDQEH